MKVELKNGHLVITIPVTDPTPSSTGKTYTVASSHGNQPTTVMIEGKPVICGVNAYIKK